MSLANEFQQEYVDLLLVPDVNNTTSKKIFSYVKIKTLFSKFTCTYYFLRKICNSTFTTKFIHRKSNVVVFYIY